MIKLFPVSIALAAASALVAVSAPAAVRSANADNGIETSPGGSNPAADQQGSEKRYCVTTTYTGSRLPVKVCKTMKEWQAEGIQVKPAH